MGQTTSFTYYNSCNLSNNLCNRYYYYPHFTDDKTEVLDLDQGPELVSSRTDRLGSVASEYRFTE